MKGLVLYLLLSLSLSFLGYSQTTIDSIRNQIDLTDDPERKVDLLNSLAYNLYDYSMEDAFQTAEQSYRQAKRINYKKGEGWALIHQGMYFLLAGHTTDALKYYKQAFFISNEIQDSDLQSYSILQVGKVQRDIGYFDSAQLSYKRAEEIQLKKSKPDAFNLCRIYSAIAKNLLTMEKASEALPYATKEMEQASQLFEREWMGYAWIDLGDVYRDNYQFDKAEECYTKAKSLYGNYSWVSTDLNLSIGIMQKMKGDFEKAFQSLSIVMRAYDMYEGKKVLATTLLEMAEILEEKGLYDVAQEYVDRALKICQSAGYIFLTAEAYYELAWINYRANQLLTANSAIKRAESLYTQIHDVVDIAGCFNLEGLIQMKQKDYDSSFYFHQRALKIRKENASQASISASLFNLGELYLDRMKLDEALNYFREGLSIDEKLQDKYGVSMYDDRLGRIYLMKNNFTEAERLLRNSIQLASQSSSFDILSAAYNDYSTLLERQGKFSEALKYRKMFESTYDSIYNRGTAQSLISYRTLYDLESKDKEIALLNLDKKAQADQLKSRNLIIYWVASISGVLVILAYSLYHYSRKQKKLNRDLSEKNEEIQTQSEELQEANLALLNLNEEVNRQREEIKNQAEELMVSHEAIANINRGLEQMVEQRTSDLRKAYQELDTFFYRSSHDFRRPLTTLMGLCEVGKLSVRDSAAIDLFEKVYTTATNLDKMLLKLQSISDVGSHQLVNKEVLLQHMVQLELDNKREIIKLKGIEVDVDINIQDPFLSYPVLVKIIIENLIENAIDFSAPALAKINVSAYQKNGSVYIKVADNGEGIKESVKPHIFEMFYRGSVRSVGNGLGLYIAKKATEKASGKITFENNDIGGTTFMVEIPNKRIL